MVSMQPLEINDITKANILQRHHLDFLHHAFGSKANIGNRNRNY